MEWTYAELRSRVKTLGGVDASDGDVGGEINGKYVELVVRSKFRLATVTVGVTVAAQGDYPLPEADVQLARLRIGTGEYELISRDEQWGLDSGRLDPNRENGVVGYFSADFDSDGNQTFQIEPAPSTSGDAIEAIVALEPSLLSADTDVPIVPRWFRPKIASGALGDLLALVDERQDQAAGWQAEFEKAVVDLGRYRRARVGSGVRQIRIVR